MKKKREREEANLQTCFSIRNLISEKLYRILYACVSMWSRNKANNLSSMILFSLSRLAAYELERENICSVLSCFHLWKMIVNGLRMGFEKQTPKRANIRKQLNRQVRRWRRETHSKRHFFCEISERERERTRIARIQCANSTNISNNRRLNLERQSDEANKKSHKQHLT